ncbi:hypothetical protein AGLY_013198 [Aphis glycines]|uniref:Uncharacterized protein n=1 Tax=Aphis glycines TaxID=307491 RepID=A0A6G0T5Z3_APHGL|nr:hypothetical protein AGLY_013198 [Aphis glycines]
MSDVGIKYAGRLEIHLTKLVDILINLGPLSQGDFKLNDLQAAVFKTIPIIEVDKTVIQSAFVQTNKSHSSIPVQEYFLRAKSSILIPYSTYFKPFPTIFLSFTKRSAKSSFLLRLIADKNICNLSSNIFERLVKYILTNLRSVVFSRRAPIHPAKLTMNMICPAMIRTSEILSITSENVFNLIEPIVFHFS